MNPYVSQGLRIAAIIAFALAFFSVSPGGMPMMPLGLCLWCISTVVP